MNVLRSVLAATLLPLPAPATDAEPEPAPPVPELPLGIPAEMLVAIPTGGFEVAQRLIPFPFLPPDLTATNRELLSRENNWFTARDKRKIDELGSYDFHAAEGPCAVAIVPKLHNTSAGIEIYRIPATTTKAAFEAREGPYRPGRTDLFMNRRPAPKIAKFKMGEMAQCGIAYFYLSRILGKLVEVPPATYRTLDVDLFNRVASQARKTGNPSCGYFWSDLRRKVAARHRGHVLPDGRFVFGSLAENPRGEDSSPPGYWTLERIRAKRFYRVLASSAPVSEKLDLSDPGCLQDLALAQDLVRGVVLDEIFRQADRLGNIGIEKFSHYVNHEGLVKWKDNPDEEDHAETVTRFVELDRIIYKDNDDGMLWGQASTTVSPILRETRHLDPVLYSRLLWLDGLMRDEGASGELVRSFFLEVVRLSPGNYESLVKSVGEVSGKLRKRVEAGEVRLDLQFETTLRDLLLREASAGITASGAEDP